MWLCAQYSMYSRLYCRSNEMTLSNKLIITYVPIRAQSIDRKTIIMCLVRWKLYNDLFNNFACWIKIFQLQKMYTFTLLSVALRLLCMCGSSQGVLNILTLEYCSYTTCNFKLLRILSFLHQSSQPL